MEEIEQQLQLQEAFYLDLITLQEFLEKSIKL